MYLKVVESRHRVVDKYCKWLTNSSNCLTKKTIRQLHVLKATLCNHATRKCNKVCIYCSKRLQKVIQSRVVVTSNLLHS